MEKKKRLYIPSEQNCQWQKIVQKQLPLSSIFYIILFSLIERLGN